MEYNANSFGTKMSTATNNSLLSFHHITYPIKHYPSSIYKISNPMTHNPTNATTLPTLALLFIAAPVNCDGAEVAELVLLEPPVTVGLDTPPAVVSVVIVATKHPN